jgi:DNA-binding MarR family transcriptional regulator
MTSISADLGTSGAAGAADGPAERAELVGELARIQQDFERRALSALADPLISTALTMQQLKVLVAIALDLGKATTRDLASLLGVSVASMSGLVDRLVEHGMVERVEDLLDRRIRRLVATEQGSGTVRTLVPNAGVIPEPVLRRLTVEDLRALVQAVRAISRATAELEAEGS